MKKFTKKLEKIENTKSYKVLVNLELIVDAENEGEAGYKSDSIISSIEKLYNYYILEIEKTDDFIKESIDYDYDEEYSQNPSNLTTYEEIEKHWEDEFEDRYPSTEDKDNWYQSMRKKGFNGIDIYKVIKDKFSRQYWAAPCSPSSTSD